MSKARLKKVMRFFCVVNLLWASVIHSAAAALQPFEYLSDDFPKARVEPEGEGTVYNVSFSLGDLFIGIYAALEGHGVGEEQWPSDPWRNDYTFIGWYDNPARTGAVYTLDTPIYKDTDLYAKWKYSGPGGYWPRPHRGVIHGIEDGGNFGMNQEFILTAEGYNMHLIAPKDQRFRWYPVSWKVSDMVTGNFSNEAPYTASFHMDTQGEYTLYITYREEIFDGVGWQETGQAHEVEELSFLVNGNAT